jgi:SAM-dependent methyltransferase
LLNTGCWVCRFEKVSSSGVSFTINDRIIFDQKADEFVAEVESEDWNFSRQLNANGLRIGATRKVALHHSGPAHFSNAAAWGEQYFDSSLVRESQLKPQPPREYVFPHYVDGWLLPVEGEALSELSRGKRVLEIGSYVGKSTICIAQTAREVVAVDPHDGRGTFRPRETRQEMLKNLRDFGLVDKVTILHPDNFDPVERDEAFDVVFLDGAHDYGSVQQDIDKVRHCLAPDGLIAFHDYRIKPGDVDSRWDPGVTQSVDELIADGGELIATHGTLAIVRPPADFATTISEANHLLLEV